MVAACTRSVVVEVSAGSEVSEQPKPIAARRAAAAKRLAASRNIRSSIRGRHQMYIAVSPPAERFARLPLVASASASAWP
jgi:hypothetical protein